MHSVENLTENTLEYLPILNLTPATRFKLVMKKATKVVYC